MSTTISEDRFSFALPSLSYIDASLDERDNYAEARAKPGVSFPKVSFPKVSFTEWLALRVAAFRARIAQRTHLAELSGLSDRELLDIGLNRGDFVRIFDNTANQDLRQRGL